MKTYTSWMITPILLISLFVAGGALAEQADKTSSDTMQLQQLLKKQAGMMTPELQEKAKALSPETKKILMQILSQHDRHSDRVTLRQVMHEVLSDYQSMIAGVVTDNPEQAAESALRIANHRIPVGGLLPYMRLDNINDDRLKMLEGFNNSVEGNARKLAEAANNGDMAKTASLAGDIASGCVACHAMQCFVGNPVSRII